jgi:hypothetical protein
MNRKMVRTITLGTLALFTTLCAARPGRAQDVKTPYPSMAPLDQYLMDRNDEIALARSAAPPSVAKDATVMVLGKNGYETAVKGTNGFVCNVDRSWMDRLDIDTPEFWNPKRRGPICFNQEAAKTLVPLLMIRTRLALAGKSKAEIKEGLKAAIDKGELPAIEPSGMSYMLAKGNPNDFPHLMFYAAPKDAKTWGSNLPNSPIIGGSPRAPEGFSVFIVPVSEWSDGTAAPPAPPM